MKEKIIEALKQLDLENDDHFTNDGSPRIDVVVELSGVKGLKRGDITGAAPAFSRDNPVFEITDEKEDEVTVEEETEDGDDLQALEIKAQKAEDVLKEAQAKALEAEKAVLEAQRARDAIIEAREAERPVHENQQNIMNYLESQKRLREAKVNKFNKAVEGIDLKQLDPVAPIDKAMARKKGHGLTRPTRG